RSEMEIRASSRRLLQQNGATLPDLIAVLRVVLATDTSAIQNFDDRLLDVGYLDVHASRYEVRRYTVRREWTFRVTGKFPRIVESQLPEGVGEVSYALSLAACAPFAIETAKAISELAKQRLSKKPNKRKS
ncbi:MAG: PD-(D/E)XK motif protein, partial [Verrucomicrobiota bacterium]